MKTESWLLSPVLEELLPPGSNILRFQEACTVTACDPEPMDVLEWVFRVASGQQETVLLSQLPEDTSLQRGMKRFLLEGKKIGTASGILSREF